MQTEERKADITERVKTFLDVLEVAGETLEDFQKRTQFDAPDEKAYKQIKLIAEVLNEGVIMDGTDTNQWKFYPWHLVSGAALSYLDYGTWGTGADVGSRLCFKNAKLAEYAGKQFLDIYTELKIK